MNDKQRSQLGNEWRKRIHLCSGLGTDLLTAILEEQIQKGTDNYICEECVKPALFSEGHLCAKKQSRMIYHFGYSVGAGHNLQSPDGIHLDKDIMPYEIMCKLDGGLCPQTRAYQEEGIYSYTPSWNGFTVISFWDRTGDGRGNSSSTFFAKGFMEREHLISRAKQLYPELFKRFTFDLVHDLEYNNQVK